MESVRSNGVGAGPVRRTLARRIRRLANRLAAAGWERPLASHLHQALQHAVETCERSHWPEAKSRAAALALADLLEAGPERTRIDPDMLPAQPGEWTFVLVGEVCAEHQGLEEALTEIGFQTVRAAGLEPVSGQPRERTLLLASTRWLARQPLPVRAAEPEAGLAATPAALRGRVLYVEDNPVNVQVMRHLFAMLPGVELDSAADGASALARLAEQPPDLVLMDIDLPDMSGIEVLRAMRAAEPTAAIPAIAVSAVAMPTEVQAGLEAGFCAYLTKPFDVPALLDLIRQQLGG
jgi:CheY-like chemotaxis protein